MEIFEVFIVSSFTTYSSNGPIWAVTETDLTTKGLALIS